VSDVVSARSDVLTTADGHDVYFETFGNESGVPLLFLHGGPGSGCSVNQRRFFDGDTFRSVFIDQRGCGRSRPLAETVTDPSTNTTQHLIADCEAIRERLGIDRWVVAGFSWGTTLALAYAQAHPERCRGVMAALVTTTSAREVRWLTTDVGCLFPAEYEQFTTFIPAHLRHLSNVEAYGEMLWGPDADEQAAAAREWCLWEDTHVSLAPGHAHNDRYDDPVFRLRFARLVTHYWRHAAFLDDEQLIRHASTLEGIPISLIHGRYDVSSPIETAWRLHQAIGSSELLILDESGHGDGSDFRPTCQGALQRLAQAP
jgi:proline iminopeptidase